MCETSIHWVHRRKRNKKCQWPFDAWPVTTETEQLDLTLLTLDIDYETCKYMKSFMDTKCLNDLGEIYHIPVILSYSTHLHISFYRLHKHHSFDYIIIGKNGVIPINFRQNVVEQKDKNTYSWSLEKGCWNLLQRPIKICSIRHLWVWRGPGYPYYSYFVFGGIENMMYTIFRMWHIIPSPLRPFKACTFYQ